MRQQPNHAPSQSEPGNGVGGALRRSNPKRLRWPVLPDYAAETALVFKRLRRSLVPAGSSVRSEVPEGVNGGERGAKAPAR